jgi:hypothetical protein
MSTRDHSTPSSEHPAKVSEPPHLALSAVHLMTTSAQKHTFALAFLSSLQLKTCDRDPSSLRSECSQLRAAPRRTKRLRLPWPTPVLGRPTPPTSWPEQSSSKILHKCHIRITITHHPKFQRNRMSWKRAECREREKANMSVADLDEVCVAHARVLVGVCAWQLSALLWATPCIE